MTTPFRHGGNAPHVARADERLPAFPARLLEFHFRPLLFSSVGRMTHPPPSTEADLSNLDPGLAKPAGPYPLAAAVIGAGLGIMAVGAALTGHLFKPNHWYEEIGFMASRVLLVWPGWTQALLGAVPALGLGGMAADPAVKYL